MTQPLERFVLITGASSGIGRATALTFARAGFHLALISRSLERLEAVVQEARQTGVKVYPYALDLSDITQVRDKVQKIVQEVGQIDVLVNNAGMGYTGTLMDTPLADWQQVLDLNLNSVFQCIQAVLPLMRTQRRGIIINMASVAAQQVFPKWGAYCVSKFGLLALSKTLAAEERVHGIRVTTLCPGAVNTPLWDHPAVQADFDRSAMLSAEVVANSILYTALLPDSAVIEEMVVMSNAGNF